MIIKISDFLKGNKSKSRMVKDIRKEIKLLEEKNKYHFENNSNINMEEISIMINPEKLIKTTTVNEKTIDIANGILEHNIFLMNTLEVIKFENEINWNYKHHTSANTYHLYFQCLNIISHLCDAFVKTQEDIYIYKAYSLLLNWINYIKTDKERNRFKWVDHTVANRVMNIVYFYNVSKGKIIINEEIIGNLLIEHGVFLENDKNYVQNNHGIMVDRSLLLLSVFMPKHKFATQWFQKAKLRISNAMYRDFSSKGVHLENSPSYHLMTRRIFNQVEDFLKSNKLTLGKEIRQQLIQTKDYIQYMIKPNSELPIIGDTQKGKVTWVKKSFESFSDTHAGITIMQSKAEIDENSTWLSFISGYGSKTHKHRDDLSISLYYNGKDILIDSGRYNYDSKDKVRQYLLSPQAHSTISIPNKDYIIDEPFKNRHKIKTMNYVSNEVYDYVKGINYAYPDIKLSRSVVFFKPNIFIIHDNIQSAETNEFQQIFNFSPDVSINDVTDEKVIAYAGDDKIVLQQIIDQSIVKKYHGDMETPRAVISEEFGKLTENNQISFSKEGKNLDFVTVLALGEGNERYKNLAYDKKNSVLSITVSEKDYKLII